MEVCQYTCILASCKIKLRHVPVIARCVTYVEMSTFFFFECVLYIYRDTMLWTVLDPVLKTPATTSYQVKKKQYKNTLWHVVR